MPLVPLGDIADPRLDIYRHLKATNSTRHLGQFVVEGEKLVDRLIESEFEVASVVATEPVATELEPRVAAEVPIYVLPALKLEELVGFNFHRGALACGLRKDQFEPLKFAASLGRRATLIVCPQVDNPENLGSLIRIADVLGAGGLLASGRCPDPLSRRVLRVSMGSALTVPVIVREDLADVIAALRDVHGFLPVATVVDPSADSIDGFVRPDRVAVFLGSEGHGLAPEWLALCERRLTIPMRAGAESLNLAVAAGICLHYLLKTPPPPTVH